METTRIEKGQTWFGNRPRNRPAFWAMNPDMVADVAQSMLTQPQHIMIDEWTVHPRHQER